MPTWTPTLIPRKVFNGKRIAITYDAYNLPTDGETAFDVENASAQPISGNDATASLQGYKDKNIYVLYTTTEVKSADEGTATKGDLIEIETGRWFRVVKVKYWNVGIRTHYEAWCVEENER